MSNEYPISFERVDNNQPTLREHQIIEIEGQEQRSRVNWRVNNRILECLATVVYRTVSEGQIRNFFHTGNSLVIYTSTAILLDWLVLSIYKL